jgi:23S rRNA (uracil1939-C5)-methyltransferase
VGRKKDLPKLENLEIIDVAAEGNSIGRYHDMVVFVPGLVPGDIADIQISRKRKKYWIGHVAKLKKESDIRQTPFCSHFGTCGGCKWQILPYEKQLMYKEKQVADQLQRIGHIDIPGINPIKGSALQQYYRNKLEFTFSTNRWLSENEVGSGKEFTDKRALGFHLPGRYDRVLNIDRCYLQHDYSNRIRDAVREYTLRNNYDFYNHKERTGLMRNLIIRNSGLGEWMVIVVFRYEDTSRISGLMNMLRTEFPLITSLNYVINPK